ncbi:MAG: hypothetical protein CMM23_05075 [Rhodospirillaceae bacterium]|nr:hypothetical protein [Rhodospirillaceae bacterium]
MLDASLASLFRLGGLINSPGIGRGADLAVGLGFAPDRFQTVDQVVEASGLEPQFKAFRLPDDNDCREITAEIKIPIAQGRDNPLWICVNTEDGF